MIVKEPCLQGLDDTDLYKESVRKVYMARYAGVPAVFQFQDRRPHRLYNDTFLAALKEQIAHIGTLRFPSESIDYLGKTTPWLGREYLEWLRNWKPKPEMVEPTVKDGLLNIRIEGAIEDASPWELYLMPTISELNFRLIQTDWTWDGQVERFLEKRKKLSQLPAWVEYGTRRRRNWMTQYMVVENSVGTPGFAGTSNIRLSRKFGLTAKGTYPHELVQTVSAMESLRYANRFTMEIWQEIFKSNLGTALPDTFGLGSFLRDFSRSLAMLFDSVRHDSGDPLEFAFKMIAHYQKLLIDPMSKTLIFSDNLNPDKCLEIDKALEGKIRRAYGIGTNLTNDFPGSLALNMVIKLIMVNGINVVKLGDGVGKRIGDPEAIAEALYVHLGIPLRESLGA